uniref:Uncharacterized protein n=1 Tax=Tetraodon nigroviridis TaxID=99883 RepID=H3C7H3_TETNG
MRKKKLKMRQQLSHELYLTAVSMSHNRTTLVPPTSTTSQMETASGSACTRTTGRTSATQTEVFNVCGMDYLTGSWCWRTSTAATSPGDLVWINAVMPGLSSGRLEGSSFGGSLPRSRRPPRSSRGAR